MNYSVSLLRFLGIYILITGSVGLVHVVLVSFAGITLPFSATSMIAPIGATWDAANQFSKKYRTLPPSGFAWSATFKMTLIELSMGLAVIAVFFFGTIPSGDRMIVGTSLLGETLLVGLFLWLLKRFLFVLFIKNLIKTTTS